MFPGKLATLFRTSNLARHPVHSIWGRSATAGAQREMPLSSVSVQFGKSWALFVWLIMLKGCAFCVAMVTCYCDIVMLCVLSSIRYHSLHPEYIHERLRALGKMYLLRILLVHVDTVRHPLLPDPNLSIFFCFRVKTKRLWRNLRKLLFWLILLWC